MKNPISYVIDWNLGWHLFAARKDCSYFCYMNIPLKRKLIDNQTRCEHYYLPEDIIAIKFKCCNIYYPCISCHEETANHKPIVWNKEDRLVKAVLCGVCCYEMSIDEYLNCKNHCPSCNANFNSKCKNHYHFYFEL